MNLKDKVPVMHCAGVEGPSLYINNFRVCGPKPWGGGRIIHEWKSAEKGDILRALGDNFLQAVNSHDELVEACAVALHVFDRIARETPWSKTTPEWWLDMMARMVVVRAALKKAGA